MVSVGYRPILWHIMRYYAHFGHKDFILCLGYKADVIKDYFLRYEETLSNDFVLSGENGGVELLRSRHRRLADHVRRHRPQCQHRTALEGRSQVRGRRAVPGQLRRRPDGCPARRTRREVPRIGHGRLAHVRSADELLVPPRAAKRLEPVTQIDDVGASDLWINGGYFIFRPAIFDVIGPDEDLIDEPFTRLIAAGQLQADPYEGYWAPLDTLKDVQAPPARLRYRAAAVGSLASG